MITAAPTSASLRTAAKPGAGFGPLPEWNLNDLYPGMDSGPFREDMAEAEAECRAMAEAHRGKLDELARAGGAALGPVVERYEAIEERLGRLASYAGLLYAGDTIDPKRAKFYGDTQERLTAASSDLLFFTLELNRIDDVVMEAALATEPLTRFRPWIEDLRRDKPYQLEDRVEQLFHEKSVSGRGAWNRLFDETLATLRFTVRGEELALEPTLNKLQDTDETVRRDAAAGLSTVFRANLRVFTLITNTLSKDKEISDRWRGFEDVGDSRHLANRVEREVVEALVEAVRAAYPRLSHRYYRLKARWFGREALNYWDRNAPLPSVEQRSIGWAEARDTVLDAYGEFAPAMADIARRFFDGRWIDAPVRPGKAPGAFAHPTVPSCHPYVLLNYQGKPRDVMTLAHELGHGVHQVLAAPNGALMAPTPLTLAETASVFGEMLTFRRLLAGTTEPAQRRAMLAAKVEDMINTVVRQIAFYSFERKVHLERRKGELTAEDLCALWMSVQAESLGPAIRLDDGYEVYWTYIPHFIHSPFYVYAYAFGDCLVNSLYGVYQRAEAGFVERYFALLSAGGTKLYPELLAPFGLDAKDPGFWEIGLSMIEGLIAELEAMEGREMTAASALYEKDFALWSAEQAAAIRSSAGCGTNLPLDWEHVAEEIESLGRSLHRELSSRMTVIVEHLLKLQTSPAAEPRRGWIDTIVRERSDIEQLLDESPSLRGLLTERLAKANAWGRRNFERSLLRHDEAAHLPQAVPGNADFELAQVIDDWFPGDGLRTD